MTTHEVEILNKPILKKKYWYCQFCGHKWRMKNKSPFFVSCPKSGHIITSYFER